MNEQLGKLYPSQGFPKPWFGMNWDSYTNMTKSKKDKIIKVLKSLPKRPVTAMIYGPAAPVVTQLLEGGLALGFMKGIDFAQYFKDTFNKESTAGPKSHIQVVVLYNVGLEPAINTGFSQRLLKGLISEYKNNNTHVFIQTDLDRPFFETQYDVRFSSRIVVKPEEDENVFA